MKNKNAFPAIPYTSKKHDTKHLSRTIPVGMHNGKRAG